MTIKHFCLRLYLIKEILFRRIIHNRIKIIIAIGKTMSVIFRQSKTLLTIILSAAESNNNKYSIGIVREIEFVPPKRILLYTKLQNIDIRNITTPIQLIIPPHF